MASNDRQYWISCACCGTWGPNSGRGLNAACYSQYRRNGTLDDWPLRRGTREKTERALDVWRREASQGTPRDDIAAQVGMSVHALEKAVERARHRGDPRAVIHFLGRPRVARMTRS